MSIRVLVDDREKKVIPFFSDVFSTPKYQFDWTIKRLTHADYAVIYEGKLIMLIERKRWGDLASSILDKRILNLENLKILRNRIGCHVIVIVEGVKPHKTAKKHHVSYSAMRAKLDHIILRDNIHVDYSKDMEGTVVRIAELCKHYMSIKTELPADSYDIKLHKQVIGEVIGGEQCEEIKDIREKKEALMGWCALPGVDLATAGMIRRAGFSLGEFLIGQLDMTELSKMKYPGSGNVVGYERAAKILKDSRKYSTYVAILSAVRGISEDVAKKVLSMYENSLAVLMEEATVRTISNIVHVKGGKPRKIGTKVAERIFDVLERKISDDSDRSSDEGEDGEEEE
jgi:ERCC4-type nuclease